MKLRARRLALMPLLVAVALAGACGGAAPIGTGPLATRVSAVCTPIELRGPDGRQIDLSGTWSGNDGGRYYIKQVDSCVWWSGLSDFEGQALGDEWIMTFRGAVDGDGVIVGDFVDVKGTNPGSGTMTIRVQAETRDGAVVVELYREHVTGHQIGVTFWQRTTPDTLPTPGGSERPASSPSVAPSSPGASERVTLPPG